MDFKGLLNKNKNDTLNEEELELVEELKNNTYELFNDDEIKKIDYDECYTYISLCKLGIVNEYEDNVNNLCERLLARGIDDFNCDELFEKYPILLEHFYTTLEYLRPRQLLDLSSYFYYKEDFDNYFNVIHFGADDVSIDLGEGFKLINNLIYINSFKYLLFECYLNGMGTEANYIKALEYYLEYREDSLVYKWGSNDTFEDSLLDLFDKLKEDYDKGLRYPGLLYSLAVMVREGIGTNYNYDLYKNILDEGLNVDKHKLTGPEQYYYGVLCELNDDKITNTDAFGNMITSVTELRRARVGDIVEFGKYENRSILWRVLDIKDGKALLLSNSVLDNLYPLGENPSLETSPSRMKDRIDETHYRDLNFFYLSKEEVERYLSNNSDRLCSGRNHILYNEFEINDGSSFPWFTSTVIDGEAFYVDTEGNIKKCPSDSYDVGLRPASWVEIK